MVFKPNSDLILCLVFLASCHQSLSKHDGPPVIKEHPKDILTRRNDPATLNCAATNADEIVWYRNGEPVATEADDSRPQKFMLFDGNLYFMRVTSNKRENDAGVYWCVAINEYGKAQSNNATLTIASLGNQFIEEPRSSVRVRQGDTLRLSCRPPPGVPNPKVTWEHNGNTVPNNTRVRTSSEGDLLFEDVLESDAGSYVCVAQNSAGSRESSTSSLVVMNPPWFEERPKNLSAVSGATVEFHCRAGGSPKPSVTWRRLDGKMPLGRVQVMEGENTLRITEVGASDSGMYVCEAKNEAGSAMTLGSVTVIVAPEAKEKPSDSLSLVNTDLILKCKVEGDPAPLLVWRLPHQDQNVLLSGGQNNNHASVSNNGSLLKVTDLNVEDSGDYFCWGISSGGGVSSRAKLVVVESLPPPLIGIRPQDQYVLPDSTVRFPCEVVSEASEATIHWWYQKAAHLPAHKIVYKRSITQLQTGTLLIKHVNEDDAGIYKCKVTSEAGAVETEAILKVSKDAIDYDQNIQSIPTLPAPPSKPRITYINSSSVHLVWLPNSRVMLESAESYTVEYWRAPWQEWRVAKAEVTATSTSINALSPDTAYIFLVRAVNDKGESFPSPWSDMIYTTSPGSSGIPLEEEKQTRRKMNKPIISLDSAAASGASSVVLKWKILEGTEVDIDGVIVYSVGETTIVTATVFGIASTSHTIHDLRPNTRYTFFLVPFLRTIEGVPSNSQTLVTPEEAPEVAPTGLSVEVFDSGTTLVKWNPLTKAEARGNIIGYRVSITHNSTTTIQETQNPWLEAQGLSEGRLYTVKVAGVSGGGMGPWSAPELIDVSQVLPVGRQDSSGEAEEVPSVFYAPPHPVWLLYLLVPIIIFLVIVTLLYLRKIRRKSPPSSIDAAMGPALYSSSGVYGPTHQVNMYGEQKLWRPTDSDQDSSLSSARLLRQEHLANEYAEPRIQRLTDSTEPYATTALLAPASPRIGRTPPGWRHGRCTEDIQVNWAALLPPPPSCPPPLNFPSHTTEGDTCSSATTSESGERRHFHTGGSSSQYENAGGAGSEQYERPCDITPSCDVASEHTYAVYAPVSHEASEAAGGGGDTFQTFSTLQANPLRRIKVDLHSSRAEPPKSNTH